MITQSVKAYVRWRRAMYYQSIAVVVIFTFLKFQTVGWENVNGFLLKTFPYNAAACLLGLGSFLGLQRKLRKFRAIERPTMADCREIITAVLLGKPIYMTAWLLFLFYPLKSPIVYDHLVGFGFVLAAISAYSSMSAVYYPLFLFDVGLQLIMAGIVTGLNLRVQETPWMAAAVLLFGLNSLITSRIISKTTASLFQSQQQMAKSVRLADSANRAKMDFLAMMSHEIRTPMSGVLGMVDVLKETPLSDEQKGFMKILVQCSQTLLNTLNDVLDSAREESGSLTIRNANCEIREIVMAAARSMEPVARKKGLDFEVTVSEELPDVINSDPFRLQQVLFNLLSNAIKFTQKGKVSLRAGMEAGQLTFEVSDTGIGISPENQARLFRKFSQADASISQKFGGSGLGLMIAKNIVELMGGRIKCMSATGKGTTFSFWIPYRPADAVATEEKLAAAGGASANILLVEDNQVNQMIAIRFLSKRGHHVILAENGDAALSALSDGHYDIILMDSNMPGKNGLEIAREIKALGPPASDIPIIAVTANAVQAHIDACRAAGMVDHVIKPFSSEQLCSVVARHLPASLAPAVEQTPPPTAAPAPVAGAPVDPPGTLQVFVDEFGPEYAAVLARKTLEEIERLSGIIMADKDLEDPEAIGEAAHDLKSVSGYIGFHRTRVAAEAVDACAQSAGKGALSPGARHELASRIETLADMVKSDVNLLRRYVAASPAPTEKAS